MAGFLKDFFFSFPVILLSVFISIKYKALDFDKDLANHYILNTTKNTATAAGERFIGRSRRFPQTITECRYFNKTQELTLDAFEDLFPYDEHGRYLLSGMAKFGQLLHLGGELTPSGSLVSIDLGTGSDDSDVDSDDCSDNDSTWPRIKVVPLHNFPKDALLHPHGVYVSKELQRLYVVNHAGPSQGGSRVDVFDIVKEMDAQEIAYLDWRTTIRSSLFGNLMINDVIEGVEENEIYITKYTTFPRGNQGVKGKRDWKQIALDQATDLAYMFQLKTTGVFRCTFDSSPYRLTKDDSSSDRFSWPADAICKLITKDSIMANGIALNKKLGIIYVMDAFGKCIRAYRRDYQGNLITLPFSPIMVPHAADNINFDPASNTLKMGSIPHIYKTTAIMLGVKGIRSPGGLQVALIDPQNGNATDIYDELVHDGSGLNGVSTCETYKDKILCSSPFHNGLLFCQKKVDPA